MGSGQKVTFCCLTRVLRDYARFARLLADDGIWEGRQLIPRQWMLDATTVRSGDGYLSRAVATPFVWALASSLGLCRTAVCTITSFDAGINQDILAADAFAHENSP